MDPICDRAAKPHLGAVYVQNRLFITARGQKPTPCHTVEVRQSPLLIFPPQYEVRQCLPAGAKCIQRVVEYTATGMFHGLPGTHVTVHYEGGSEQVPVTTIDDPAGAPADAADLVAAKASDADTSLEPLRLGTLLETGDASGVRILAGERVEATGYSSKFSFDEAFQDAIGNLPPDRNPFPDKLTTVRVESIGAEFGGIAGLHRMVVRVSSRH